MNQDRYAQGLLKLKEIHGEAGEQVIESLKDIAPDLGRYIIQFAFGDIYSGSGLDLKSREIATIAALKALGNAQPQLKVCIDAALNVGCTRFGSCGSNYPNGCLCRISGSTQRHISS